MKRYLSNFIEKEDGIETIEFVALLAIAAILLGIVANVANALNTTGSNAETKIKNGLQDIDGVIGGQAPAE